MTVNAPPPRSPFTSSVGRAQRRSRVEYPSSPCSVETPTSARYASSSKGTRPSAARSASASGSTWSSKPGTATVPSPWCNVATMRARAEFGFWTAPPWRPEWRSAAGPSTTRSSASRPFAAIAIDGSNRRIRTIRRDDQVGGELVTMSLQERTEARAADLLLALDQEADVEGKPTVCS